MSETEPTEPTEPTEMLEVLTLDEEDPGRSLMETRLRALDLVELRALWQRTRESAAIARRAGDMVQVILLVRGSKTIQRIADERGVIFSARTR